MIGRGRPLVPEILDQSDRVGILSRILSEISQSAGRTVAVERVATNIFVQGKPLNSRLQNLAS